MTYYVIRQQGSDNYWSGSYWGDLADAARYSKYGAKEKAQWLAEVTPGISLVLTLVQ